MNSPLKALYTAIRIQACIFTTMNASGKLDSDSESGDMRLMLAIKEVATECPLQTPNETTIPLAIQTSEYEN